MVIKIKSKCPFSFALLLLPFAAVIIQLTNCDKTQKQQKEDGNEEDKLHLFRGKVIPGDTRYIVTVKCDSCDNKITTQYTYRDSGRFLIKLGLSESAASKNYATKSELKFSLEVRTRYEQGNQIRENKWENKVWDTSKEHLIRMGHWEPMSNQAPLYLSAKFINPKLGPKNKDGKELTEFQYNLLVLGKNENKWVNLIQMPFKNHEEINEPFKIEFGNNGVSNEKMALQEYIQTRKKPSLKLILMQLPKDNCHFCDKGFLKENGIEARNPKILSDCEHAFHKKCLDMKLQENNKQGLGELHCPVPDCQKSGIIGTVTRREKVKGFVMSLITTSYERKQTANWKNIKRIIPKIGQEIDIPMPIFEVGEKPEFTYELDPENALGMNEKAVDRKEMKMTNESNEEDGERREEKMSFEEQNVVKTSLSRSNSSNASGAKKRIQIPFRRSNSTNKSAAGGNNVKIDRMHLFRGKVIPGDTRYIVTVECQSCEIKRTVQYTYRKSGRFIIKLGLLDENVLHYRPIIGLQVRTRRKKGGQIRQNKWDIELDTAKEYRIRMGHWAAESNGAPLYLSAQFANPLDPPKNKDGKELTGFRYNLFVKKTNSVNLIHVPLTEEMWEKPFKIEFNPLAIGYEHEANAMQYVRSTKRPTLKLVLMQLPVRKCNYCLTDFLKENGIGARNPKILNCGHAFHKECLDKMIRKKQKEESKEIKTIEMSCPVCQLEQQEQDSIQGSIKGTVTHVQKIKGNLFAKEQKQTANWDHIERVFPKIGHEIEIPMPIFQVGEKPEFTYQLDFDRPENPLEYNRKAVDNVEMTNKSKKEQIESIIESMEKTSFEKQVIKEQSNRNIYKNKSLKSNDVTIIESESMEMSQVDSAEPSATFKREKGKEVLINDHPIIQESAEEAAIFSSHIGATEHKQSKSKRSKDTNKIHTHRGKSTKMSSKYSVSNVEKRENVQIPRIFKKQTAEEPMEVKNSQVDSAEPSATFKREKGKEVLLNDHPIIQESAEEADSFSSHIGATEHKQSKSKKSKDTNKIHTDRGKSTKMGLLKKSVFKEEERENVQIPRIVKKQTAEEPMEADSSLGHGGMDVDGSEREKIDFNYFDYQQSSWNGDYHQQHTQTQYPHQFHTDHQSEMALKLKKEIGVSVDNAFMSGLFAPLPSFNYEGMDRYNHGHGVENDAPVGQQGIDHSQASQSAAAVHKYQSSDETIYDEDDLTDLPDLEELDEEDNVVGLVRRNRKVDNGNRDDEGPNQSIYADDEFGDDEFATPVGSHEGY